MWIKAQETLRSRRPTEWQPFNGTLISTARSLKRSKRKPRPSLKTLVRHMLCSLTHKRDKCMTMEQILRKLIKVEVVAVWVV